MGYELALALVVGVVLYAVCYYYFMDIPEQQDMAQPAGLDEFQVTQTNEGTAVTLVYGKRRTKGNVLWYGGLSTSPIWGGGGGSDPDPVIVGYTYYLDVWQSVCIGPATLHKYYVDNDDNEVIIAIGTYWSNGVSNWAPTVFVGQYATKLTGVAHMFWYKWQVGDNTTRIPVVHFVVSSYPSNAVTYIEESNGCNPAAIIYDLLIRAGATDTDIDLASFNTAATFWHNQGYALNMAFTKQMPCRQAIAQVGKYVDFVFSVTTENKFYIKAMDPDEAKIATIVTKEFTSFNFARKSWSDTYNDFRANITDEDKDSSARILALRNMANMWLTGRKRQMSIDLAAYRDCTTGSQRLWEIMKMQSYPLAEFDFSTNLKYAGVNVGQVLELVNEDYGISSVYVRVKAKDINEYDQNKVGFKATQVLERLFDAFYVESGNAEWEDPDMTIIAITNQAVIELPWINTDLSTGPNYLFLAERPNEFETSFVVLKSNDGTDYEVLQIAHRWAQYGTLDETYPVTFDIDDDNGILYTPSKEDPSFDSISRTNLFALSRLAIINGQEIIAFQTVTPEGDNSIRLTGVLRGLFNTTIQSHAAGQSIWLFDYPTNISKTIAQISTNQFYIKYLPSFAGVTLDASDATPITVNRANTNLPYPITRIVAVRSGSSVTITIWPTTQYWPGSGSQPAESIGDVYPFSFNGSFDHYRSTDTTVVNVEATEINITDAAAFTFYVRHKRVDGKTSAYVPLSVGSGDGTYYGPDA